MLGVLIPENSSTIKKFLLEILMEETQIEVLRKKICISG